MSVQKAPYPTAPRSRGPEGAKSGAIFHLGNVHLSPLGVTHTNDFHNEGRGDYPRGRQCQKERGLQSVQSQLPVRSHPPGRQLHSPSEGKAVARLEGSGINLSHLDSSRTNESRGRTIMVSRKYAVRINFCCRSCPTAPGGPEGGAIFHPGDVKLFPFWGPFTNDVRQGGRCYPSRQDSILPDLVMGGGGDQKVSKILADTMYEWPLSPEI